MLMLVSVSFEKSIEKKNLSFKFFSIERGVSYTLIVDVLDGAFVVVVVAVVRVVFVDISPLSLITRAVFDFWGSSESS